MLINSKEFGKIDVDEKQILSFPQGIYGFEEHTRWALIDTSKKPFYSIQSLQKEHISFIVINPYLICTNYVLNIAESDINAIDSPKTQHLLVFSLITVRENPRLITANLAGPILINRHRHCGVQAIQQDARWDTRFPIMKQATTA